MSKKWYAGHSYMGVDFTYDSPCWTAYVFDSKAERDQWVHDNAYNDRGNLVAESISRAVAYKIAGLGGKYSYPAVERDYPHNVLVDGSRDSTAIPI